MPFNSKSRLFQKRKYQFIIQERIPELQRIEQLIHIGELGKALNEIEKLEKEGKLDENGQLRNQILKSLVITDSGQPNSGLALADRVHKASLGTDSPLTIIDALISMANALLHLSRLTECLKVINDAENILKNLVEDHFELARRDSALKLIKGKVYRRTGELDTALELIKNCLSLRMELGNTYATGDPLNEIGISYARKGDFDLALKYLEQSLKIFEDAGNKAQIVKIRNNIGMIYSNKGERDQALELYRKALVTSEELGNKRYVSAISLNIGLIYYSRGELNSALDFYQKSAAIFEELESQAEIAFCLNNIGMVYEIKGELDLALEFYQRSLEIAEKLDMKKIIAAGFNNVGRILHERGDFASALTHYEKSLRINNKIGYSLDICDSLVNLVFLVVSQGTPEKADSYLQQLQEIDQRGDNKIISQNYRLAKAMVLKTSSRVRDKAKAEALFEHIIEEEVVDHRLTVAAMLNLCDLLLEELRAFGNPTVLQEAKTLMQRTYALAQEQHSFSLVIESLILQAKLAMIDGNLTAAVKFLEQARMTAEEKNLGLLGTKVVAERQRLDDQYESWERLIQDNAPFQARLEQARCEDYFNRALNLVIEGRKEGY